MDQDAITQLLVAEGRLLFSAPRKFVEFTSLRDANELLNDLEQYPHAFLLACIMDRQVHTERAWLIPYRLAEKIGSFGFRELSELSLEHITALMTKPESLHRYAEEMGKNLHRAIRLLAEKYSGNAARIWAGAPSSAEVVYRFLEFRGVGPKIATMAANILAREFKIPFSDYFSIDISADVHVRRVFGRLGLTEPNSSVEAVIYRARALHPEFPGIFDLPVWEIGHKWCRPQTPLCGACYMRQVCPSHAGGARQVS